MAKKVLTLIKLQVPGGNANPAPPDSIRPGDNSASRAAASGSAASHAAGTRPCVSHSWTAWPATSMTKFVVRRTTKNP